MLFLILYDKVNLFRLMRFHFVAFCLKDHYIAGAWRISATVYGRQNGTGFFPPAPADWWQRDRSGKETPLHKFNDDMVFIDGRLLQAAGYEGEVDENSFYIDYKSGLVYIGI